MEGFLKGVASQTGMSALCKIYILIASKCDFRMYPITWATSRITQEDIEVAGYKIPAGVSRVSSIVLLTHSHTMTPFDAPGKQAF